MRTSDAIVGFLRSGIGRHARRMMERIVIRNFAEMCGERPRRRALLSYLVLPLLPPKRFRERIMFSNRGIAQELVYSLNELGYSVDIVNFDNDRWSPADAYDLFVGHGGCNFARFATALSAPALYFSTGSYWKVANEREAERFATLARRTGRVLPPDRIVPTDEEEANRAADGIVCLGNADVVATYAGFRRVTNVDNGTYPLDEPEPKTHAATRDSFLFFAGPGNVHKGLDRLLEAFAGSDAVLHVCQRIEAPFEELYRRHLYRMPNVVTHGFTEMRSEKFAEVARRCSWVILPTCAEGQPGSVLECMAHGLIPVLPPQAHIDLEDFGVPIASTCEVDEIRDAVARCRALSREECVRRSDAVRSVTARRYSPSGFRTGMKRAITSVLQQLAGSTSARGNGVGKSAGG